MRKSCITVLSVLVLLAVASAFIGCDKATPDPNYNYRVTGAFADWGSNFEQRFMMTNVAKSDERLKSISSALKDAQYVYIYDYTPNASGAAGWTVDYSGPRISVDGRFAVKLIRLEKDTSDPSGWGFNMWMPSTESGGLKNLNPDVMFVPMDRSDEARDAARDGMGSNNDNPVLLKGDVGYYIVFAVFKDRSRGIGAVLK
ncbi:MAG: hypothetical protein LBI14_10885 [Treponema sp.]|jgi:hypothetical protein|nr:hypothetical protein [Treponema sp.]